MCSLAYQMINQGQNESWYLFKRIRVVQFCKLYQYLNSEGYGLFSGEKEYCFVILFFCVLIKNKKQGYILNSVEERKK